MSAIAPLFQAMTIVPAERAAGGPLHHGSKAAVVGDDVKRVFSVADDDCGGDRQGVKQAGVIRRHKVRSSNLNVRPLLPGGCNRAPCGGLHVVSYDAEGLIPSIFSPGRARLTEFS